MATPSQLPAVTPDLWHIAPDYPVSMALHAQRAVEEGKSFFFDPGQALPDFLAVPSMVDDILPLPGMLAAAKGIFVNDYEADLLIARTGHPLETWLMAAGQFYIRTRGSQGVRACVRTYDGELQYFECGVAPARAIIDPTGCGDAFRAGFLFGYTKGWTMPQSLCLGSVMGSFAIEAHGGQNHRPTAAAIWERFAAFFESEHGAALGAPA
jgi:adenosine kinase